MRTSGKVSPTAVVTKDMDSGESTKDYFEHLAGQQYELNQRTLSAAFSLADAIFHRAV